MSGDALKNELSKHDTDQSGQIDLPELTKRLESDDYSVLDRQELTEALADESWIMQLIYPALSKIQFAKDMIAGDVELEIGSKYEAIACLLDDPSVKGNFDRYKKEKIEHDTKLQENLNNLQKEVSAILSSKIETTKKYWSYVYTKDEVKKMQEWAQASYDADITLSWVRETIMFQGIAIPIAAWETNSYIYRLELTSFRAKNFPEKVNPEEMMTDVPEDKKRLVIEEFMTTFLKVQTHRWKIPDDVKEYLPGLLRLIVCKYNPNSYDRSVVLKLSPEQILEEIKKYNATILGRDQKHVQESIQARDIRETNKHIERLNLIDLNTSQEDKIGIYQNILAHCLGKEWAIRDSLKSQVFHKITWDGLSLKEIDESFSAYISHNEIGELAEQYELNTRTNQLSNISRIGEVYYKYIMKRYSDNKAIWKAGKPIEMEQWLEKVKELMKEPENLKKLSLKDYRMELIHIVNKLFENGDDDTDMNLDDGKYSEKNEAVYHMRHIMVYGSRDKPQYIENNRMKITNYIREIDRNDTRLATNIDNMLATYESWEFISEDWLKWIGDVRVSEGYEWWKDLNTSLESMESILPIDTVWALKSDTKLFDELMTCIKDPGAPTRVAWGIDVYSQWENDPTILSYEQGKLRTFLREHNIPSSGNSWEIENIRRKLAAELLHAYEKLQSEEEETKKVFEEKIVAQNETNLKDVTENITVFEEKRKKDAEEKGVDPKDMSTPLVVPNTDGTHKVVTVKEYLTGLKRSQREMKEWVETRSCINEKGECIHISALVDMQWELMHKTTMAQSFQSLAWLAILEAHESTVNDIKHHGNRTTDAATINIIANIHWFGEHLSDETCNTITDAIIEWTKELVIQVALFAISWWIANVAEAAALRGLQLLTKASRYAIRIAKFAKAGEMWLSALRTFCIAPELWIATTAINGIVFHGANTILQDLASRNLGADTWDKLNPFGTYLEFTGEYDKEWKPIMEEKYSALWYLESACFMGINKSFGSLTNKVTQYLAWNTLMKASQAVNASMMNKILGQAITLPGELVSMKFTEEVLNITFGDANADMPASEWLDSLKLIVWLRLAHGFKSGLKNELDNSITEWWIEAGIGKDYKINITEKKGKWPTLEIYFTLTNPAGKVELEWRSSGPRVQQAMEERTEREDTAFESIKEKISDTITMSEREDIGDKNRREFIKKHNLREIESWPKDLEKITPQQAQDIMNRVTAEIRDHDIRRFAEKKDQAPETTSEEIAKLTEEPIDNETQTEIDKIDERKNQIIEKVKGITIDNVKKLGIIKMLSQRKTFITKLKTEGKSYLQTEEWKTILKNTMKYLFNFGISSVITGVAWISFPWVGTLVSVLYGKIPLIHRVLGIVDIAMREAVVEKESQEISDAIASASSPDKKDIRVRNSQLTDKALAWDKDSLIESLKDDFEKANIAMPELSADLLEGIHKAHKIWWPYESFEQAKEYGFGGQEGELINVDGKLYERWRDGIKPAWVENYGTNQLWRKINLLREKWWSHDQRDILLKEGYCGSWETKTNFIELNYLDPKIVDKILDSFTDNYINGFIWEKYSNFSEWDLYYTFTKFQELYPNHPRIEEVKQRKREMFTRLQKSIGYPNTEAYLKPSSAVKSRRENLNSQKIQAEEVAKEKEKMVTDRARESLLQDTQYQERKGDLMKRLSQTPRLDDRLYYLTRGIKQRESSWKEATWWDIVSLKLDTNPNLTNKQILESLPENLKADQELIDFILLLYNYSKTDCPGKTFDYEWISTKYNKPALEKNFDYFINKKIPQHIKGQYEWDYNKLFELFTSQNIDEVIRVKQKEYEDCKQNYSEESDNYFFQSLNCNGADKSSSPDMLLQAMIDSNIRENKPMKDYHWTPITREKTHSKDILDREYLVDDIVTLRKRYEETEDFSSSDKNRRLTEEVLANATNDIKKIMVHYGIEFKTALLIYKLELLKSQKSKFFSPADNTEVQEFSSKQWYNRDLPIDELIALRQYQTWYVSYINGLLRTWDTKNSNVANLLIDKVSSAIERNKLQEETTLYRIVYNDWVDLRNGKKVWDISLETAFVSTSFTDRYQKEQSEKRSNSIVLEISAPPGTSYINMEEHFSGWTTIAWGLDSRIYRYTGQDEILLQKNTTFEVTDISTNEQGQTVYKVKIINEVAETSPQVVDIYKNWNAPENLSLKNQYNATSEQRQQRSETFGSDPAKWRMSNWEYNLTEFTDWFAKIQKDLLDNMELTDLEKQAILKAHFRESNGNEYQDNIAKWKTLRDAGLSEEVTRKLMEYNVCGIWGNIFWGTSATAIDQWKTGTNTNENSQPWATSKPHLEKLSIGKLNTIADKSTLLLGWDPFNQITLTVNHLWELEVKGLRGITYLKPWSEKVIGREANNNEFELNGNASREHIQIVYTQDKQIKVIDLNSTNGTECIIIEWKYENGTKNDKKVDKGLLNIQDYEFSIYKDKLPDSAYKQKAIEWRQYFHERFNNNVLNLDNFRIMLQDMHRISAYKWSTIAEAWTIRNEEVEWWYRLWAKNYVDWLAKKYKLWDVSKTNTPYTRYAKTWELNTLFTEAALYLSNIKWEMANAYPNKLIILKNLADYYHTILYARPMGNVNNSMFMNQVNYLLKQAGMQPVPHGHLDHIATRVSKEQFRVVFDIHIKWLLPLSTEKMREDNINN